MSESKKTTEQVEQERLTRRAALRKLGFGAGLSAFMLLGVDDLARMVGTKMAQMDGDNKVAGQIAKEFQSAGVAMAAYSPSGCFESCPGHQYADDCESCCDKYCTNGCDPQNGSNCVADCYAVSNCVSKPIKPIIV